MEIFTKLCVLILFFSKFNHVTSADTFENVGREKHLDWVFYADDFTRLGVARRYISTSVSYIRTMRQIRKYLEYESFEEESRDVLMVRICQNVTSFFKSLRQISKYETTLDSSKDWRPKYFVVWPEAIKTAQEAKSLFENTIIKEKYSQNLSIDNNVYIVIPIERLSASGEKESPSLSLWESYSANKNESAIFTELLPMNWYNLTNKLSRRSNLQRAVIRVMTADDPYYETVAKFKIGVEPPEFEKGTAVSLLQFLQDRLNFTIAAVKGSFTYENQEGEITGGALEIEQGLADLCISQTPMTPRREKHIHFLQPTFLEGLRAYFIQPSANQFRDIYLKSFSRNVWMALVSTWIVVLITMHTFAWIKDRFTENEVLDKDVLNESMLWALGAACQQGWHKQPSSLSMRLVFLIAYLTSVVCFVAFSASIVSSLSIRTYPIKTFDDLINAEFKVFVLEQSTAIVFLDQELLESQKGFNYIVSNSVAHSYLLGLKSTLVTYPGSLQILTSGYNYTDDFLCKTFYSLPLKKGPIRSAMMVQRGSSYTEFFNYQILVMRERGIIYRFNLIHLRATSPPCLDFSAGYTQSLEMIDVRTAFAILVIGHILALIVFGMEFVWATFCLKKINGVEIYVT